MIMRKTVDIDNEIWATERKLEQLRIERSRASVEEYMEEVRAKIAAEPPKELSEEEMVAATERILREGGPLADLMRKNLAEQEDLQNKIAEIRAAKDLLP